MATVNSLELSGHLCPPSMRLLLSPTINITSAIQTLSKSRDSQHCSRHSCIWVQMFPWNYLTLGDMKHRHIWEMVTLKNKKSPREWTICPDREWRSNRVLSAPTSEADLSSSEVRDSWVLSYLGTTPLHLLGLEPSLRGALKLEVNGQLPQHTVGQHSHVGWRRYGKYNNLLEDVSHPWPVGTCMSVPLEILDQLVLCVTSFLSWTLKFKQSNYNILSPFFLLCPQSCLGSASSSPQRLKELLHLCSLSHPELTSEP